MLPLPPPASGVQLAVLALARARAKVDAAVSSQGAAVTLEGSIKLLFKRDADDALLQRIASHEAFARSLPWKSAIAVGIRKTGAVASAFSWGRQRPPDAADAARARCAQRLRTGPCRQLYGEGKLLRDELREWLVEVIVLVDADAAGAVQREFLKGLGKLPVTR